MPRRTEDKWEDNDFDSGDDDSDFETEEADEEPTIPCPYCRRLIHEDAQRCPYCENYISAEDSPAAASLVSQKPLWFVAGLLLCLLIVVLWIVGSR